jgi:hypothetical protein
MELRIMRSLDDAGLAEWRSGMMRATEKVKDESCLHQSSPSVDCGTFELATWEV